MMMMMMSDNDMTVSGLVVLRGGRSLAQPQKPTSKTSSDRTSRKDVDDAGATTWHQTASLDNHTHHQSES